MERRPFLGQFCQHSDGLGNQSVTIHLVLHYCSTGTCQDTFYRDCESVAVSLSDEKILLALWNFFHLYHTHHQVKMLGLYPVIKMLLTKAKWCCNACYFPQKVNASTQPKEAFKIVRYSTSIASVTMLC